MPTTPYEETAHTRPRVRRDVLFTETPHGVIFHNADGGFQLSSPSAYRFATLIVPHLDGSRTVAEICAGFKDPQKAMVGGLVKALYARGFARSVPDPAEPGRGPSVDPAVAAVFAEQIAYVDHYADDAERRFAAYRDTAVAVLGDGPVARWCALSLVRNGCARVGLEAAAAEGPGAEEQFGTLRREAAELTARGARTELVVLPGGAVGAGTGGVDGGGAEAAVGGAEGAGAGGMAGVGGWGAYEGYGVVVVAGGRDAFGTAYRLLRQGVPEGRLLLPAWTFGGRAVVGPVSAPDSGGCLACAALRLGATGDAAVAADLWSGLALGGAAGPVPRGPLAAMLGNLLGYEVFRLATGALPAETRGQVLLQDMASFDVLAERLLPHPRCPFCRTRPTPPEPVDLSAAPERPAFQPVVAAAPDDPATDGPLAELDRRSLAVRPSVGVFTRYADEPVTQTPLKVGAVEVALGAAGTRTVAAFDVHHTAGARLRALDAAAALYAEHVAPAGPGGPALEPGAEPGAESGAAGRDPLPRVDPDLLTTATGAGGDPVVSWAVATSLVTKEEVRVPAGAVRPFGPDNQDRRYEPSRAGRGAGGGLPEAAAAGLLSALAHDALRRSVRGAGRTSPIPRDAFGDDPEVTFLLRSAGHMGVGVELLDLGEADRSGAWVVLARTAARDTAADEPVRWAVGAALERTAAAVDALRDLLGTVQLAEEGVLGAPDTGDPLLADLDAALIPVTDRDGDGDGSGPGSGSGSGSKVSADAPVTWTEVLERLAAAGRDALVVPTHGADLPAAGMHTVRVLLTEAAGDDR
ncbi:TOMM precursor leader peptide-binding protein [Streptomyces fradiae]|uniref:TOMM precursor leader peptide-binding protein n=1 Tax=Streptomyces fradiae TaxID=1906 RepID=UPI0039860B6C